LDEEIEAIRHKTMPKSIMYDTILILQWTNNIDLCMVGSCAHILKGWSNPQITCSHQDNSTALSSISIVKYSKQENSTVTSIVIETTFDCKLLKLLKENPGKTTAEKTAYTRNISEGTW